MSVFPAVRIEGGLFAPDLLDKLILGDLPGQRPQDFGLNRRRNLTDEISAVLRQAQSLWKRFQHRLELLCENKTGTSETREFIKRLLSLLGYNLQPFSSHENKVGGLSFSISHRAGEDEYAPPVHIVSIRQELGRVERFGRSRLAPHSLVQEFLNRTEALWGLVTNGKVLRLLRDSTYIRRQCYLEFDLEAIFEQHLFQDFSILYRLLHRSRLPYTGADAHQCLLEQYYQYSIEQGGRVREHLRDGVEECLKRLANGFLSHLANQELRDRIGLPAEDPRAISPQELYRQLLRLVYRFLFLLVAEDRKDQKNRNLLTDDPLYHRHYGVARFRRLVDQRAAYTDHDDLWHSLRLLWKLLSDDTLQAGGRPLASLLGLPVLNGELFSRIALDNCLITNHDLLSALWYLINYRETPGSSPRRINYAALDVEELGSVYESLLDYHPQIDTSGPFPRFDLTPGSERRSTGSYYTPAELVGELIRSALEPVIEERLKETKTREEKEKALLSIKVLDPACGSGHFLLAAARRLGKELARARTGEDEPAPEAVREAIREVIAHCIYGVDKNPLAVELCRVALWLEAHVPGKPLTFLDHRIKCGDSLVGVFDLEVLKKGIPDEAFKPVAGDDNVIARALKRQNQEQRSGQKGLFSGKEPELDFEDLAVQARRLEEIPDDSPETIHEKQKLYAELKQKAERYRTACNLWTAAFFQTYDPKISAEAFITTDVLRRYLEIGAAHPQAMAQAEALAEEHHFFHWPLEFPEVFARGGFDVILGNPPFMGGLKISGKLGDKYRRYLKIIFNPFKGTADLCAAFYRRGYDIIRQGGYLGMVATNTIGQGDTRESGLAEILKQDGVITFAKRFVKWPGEANVEVNLVTIYKSDHSFFSINHSPILDGKPVPFISSRLDDEPEAEPKRLPQNENKAFIGYLVRGIGFVLEPEEVEQLLTKDPRNADCLFPYLNGEDLNSHPEQKPSRWVIFFQDWDLERASQYPDLLRIVEERVKPEREKLPPTSSDYRKLRRYWWRFARFAINAQNAIASLRRVLVRSRVSELHMLTFVSKDWICNEQTIVFAFDDYYHFALLQSNVHEAWLRRESSSLRTDVRYTPTTCFDTFPLPPEEYRRMASGKWRLEDLPASFREAARIGEEYHKHRRQIMLKRQIGLTKTYNLLHDPNCSDADIQLLRELHAEMDRTILACYGWDDIDPQHDFYPNARGQIRFTISPEARREILHRLLELNLELAENETYDDILE